MKRIYEIPYIEKIKGNEKQVVVIAHGFGSSMQSPTAQMMLEVFEANGIGAIAFDFPAHGASPVTGDDLSVANCIADLEFVAKYAAAKCANAEIGYFGSSFGAYITLLYLAQSEQGQAAGTAGASECTPQKPRTKAFLRSAAVNMPDVFDDPTEAERFALEQQGHLIINYGTPLKLTARFLEDLKAHDLFETFRQLESLDADITMIHGTQDEDIDYRVAKDFAEEFGIPLITVEGGDHRLSGEGIPELVARKAIDFFQDTFMGD